VVHPFSEKEGKLRAKNLSSHFFKGKGKGYDIEKATDPTLSARKWLCLGKGNFDIRGVSLGEGGMEVSKRVEQEKGRGGIWRRGRAVDSYAKKQRELSRHSSRKGGRKRVNYKKRGTRRGGVRTC